MAAGLVMWAILSPVAAVMAYLITYEEWRRHFPDPRRARREALITAGVTLVFFLAIGLVVAYVLERVIR